ncbi:hypothetical protein BDQ12DRAFT_90231 [Crucibulum laeve]|uniref:Uncharacterized protein n=1 Tax=Crucibulum laeve TaxID=68775 RepID=A0A5C3M5G7_9AGAR|nr:hypothetical protein BDQ12DRAFT_90231 [Crucibulum laeve]
MALTQSARLPGPSWDEEVVPALRKRLESESRTLARRMSAISLSSVDESPSNGFTALPESKAREMGAESSNRQGTAGTRLYTGYQQQASAAAATPRANGSKKQSTTVFPRSRTYSQPFTTDVPSNQAVIAQTTGKTVDPTRSFSPRPTDVKPTRIPKASRGPPGSSYTNGSSPSIPLANGYAQNTATATHSPPELYRGLTLPDTTANSSRSTVNVPHNPTPRILNEPPPFQPGSITSSMAYSSQNGHEDHDEAPPRPSNDSEEHPFEHWYRGEVSRNGGVGELRVGRRQEMLEIANYGHMIDSRNKASTSRTPGVTIVEDYRRHRKRADSIAGLTNKERQRGSLYLDDERAAEVGRVLDENPPTDFEGESEISDAESPSDYHTPHNGYSYDYPHVGDVSTASEPLPRSQTTNDVRSTTPTPSTLHRPASRQQNGHPTRIPGRSSRRSSESRVPTPTQSTRVQTEPPSSMPSTSTSSSTPSPHFRTPHTTPSAQKRGASPASASASKKSRTVAGKATRARTAAARRELEEEEKRRNVAHYPTPSEGSDMADAIPVWTQPVLRQGNWDEVVLPVVARKKGLDDHYEKADGSPQPKKVDNTIEPAPGTFGFDHSKYRPLRGDAEYIPMDEFGRPTERIDEEESTDKLRSELLPTSAHDETRLPVRHPPPSPVPFSQYAPAKDTMYVHTLGEGDLRTDIEQGRREEEKEAGCCKCIIM